MQQQIATKKLSVRATAAIFLDEVVMQKKSLDAVFNYSKKSVDALNAPDQSLLQELCYGSLRWYQQLECLVTKLLPKPLRAKENVVLMLLMIGIYQFLYTRIPEYAAVAATVNAARELKKEWAAGLINAVLRNFLRRKEELMLQINNDVVAVYSHRAWMIEAIRKTWPQNWQEILLANNQHPPLHLRVNLRETTRDDYLQLLAQQEIAATATKYNKAGITIESAVAVEKLPQFAQGWVSVQDLASQLVAELLELQPGMRVLDACAAPGGKLTHILEMEANLTEVVALEIEAGRLPKITENLQRLKLQATLLQGDASRPEAWWQKKQDGEWQKFSRILIDAPCSATGVIRRHPDIKNLRTKEDIQNLAQRQLAILEALWPLLENGGILVYATCSIFAEENWLNIERFLAKHQDAQEKIITAAWGKAMKFGRQILPGMDNMDGFYYAQLTKGNCSTKF